MPVQRVKLVEARRHYMQWDYMRKNAEGTKLNHQRTLEGLQDVVGPNFIVADLTSTHFHATIARLAEAAPEEEQARRARAGKPARSGRDEVSLNIDRGNLRVFVRFLHDANYLSRSVNPAATLINARRMRRASTKRESLRDDMPVKLLELADQQHPRDRMICALALFGGLRESEIRRLKVSEVKRDEGVLDFYRPKLRDYHRVGISPVLGREIDRWFNWYREHNGELQPNWYVCPPKRQVHAYRKELQAANPNLSGMPGMNRNWPVNPAGYGPKGAPSWSLRAVIKPFFAELGIDNLDGKGMHTLRRTFANMMRAAGHDIRVIQETLGHASQTTTELYMDIDIEHERARAALAAFDPFPESDPNVVDIRNWRRNAG